MPNIIIDITFSGHRQDVSLSPAALYPINYGIFTFFVFPNMFHNYHCIKQMRPPTKFNSLVSFIFILPFGICPQVSSFNTKNRYDLLKKGHFIANFYAGTNTHVRWLMCIGHIGYQKENEKSVWQLGFFFIRNSVGGAFLQQNYCIHVAFSAEVIWLENIDNPP